jgi:hypothetical protein
MDKMDYGLSEPKLALMGDGGVFVAGQIQAPMEAPAVPQTMRWDAKAGVFRSVSQDSAGMVLMIGSALLGTAVCPPLVSIKFTSDHGVLLQSQNANDWGDSSMAFTKPEWHYQRNQILPVSQTMGTSLKISVQVYAGPAGTQFDLIGSGSHDYSTFQKTGIISNGRIQNIPLTASAPLPNSVGILSERINWTIRYAGNTSNVGRTGPFKIYVTYGTPTGSLATEQRVSWCCQTASGESTLDGIASKIFDALDVAEGVPPVFQLDGELNVPSPIWLLMSSSSYNGQCIHLAQLMQKMVLMLGGSADIGYIYGSTTSSCFSTSPTASVTSADCSPNSPTVSRTRICPGGVHGEEQIFVRSAQAVPCVIDSTGWNQWEAVCTVNGTCYAVQVAMGTPVEVLKEWLGLNIQCPPPVADVDETYQLFEYIDSNRIRTICTVPGPFPAPKPQ